MLSIIVSIYKYVGFEYVEYNVRKLAVEIEINPKPKDKADSQQTVVLRNQLKRLTYIAEQIHEIQSLAGVDSPPEYSSVGFGS